MRRRSRARNWSFPGGRNALVERLARLIGLVAMAATIIPLAFLIGDTPTDRLVYSIVGFAAGLLAYGIVVKVFWRD